MSEEGSKAGCTIIFNLGIAIGFLVLVLNWFNPTILSLDRLNNFFNTLQPENTRQMWAQPLIISDPSTNDSKSILVLNAKAFQTKVDNYIDKVQKKEDGLPVMLSFIDIETHQVFWDKKYKDSEASDLSRAKILSQDGLAFLWLNKKMQAIEAQNGQIIWEKNLRGQKPPNCHNCLELRDNQLFALDNQSILRSLSAANGNILWKVDLKKADFSFGLYLVGREVAILDNNTVTFFDTNSGEQLRSISPKISGKVQATFFDKFKERLLFVIQSGNQTHLELWQVKPHQRLWFITLTNQQFVPNFSKKQFFFTDRHLFFPVEQASQRILMKVSLRTGKFRPFFQSNEYELQVLDRLKNDILIKAKYLKGSEDNQVWLVNENTATTLWKHTLEAKNLFLQPEEPQDIFSSQWDFKVQNDEIKVIQLLENPQRLVYKTIGISDGKTIFERNTPIQDIFWGGTTWMENKAYLNFQNLYELNFENGKLDKVFP